MRDAASASSTAARDRYPWDEETLKAGGVVERVGPEGVRPKGLSEKEWAIRKLKAQRASEREGL